MDASARQVLVSGDTGVGHLGGGIVHHPDNPQARLIECGVLESQRAIPQPAATMIDVIDRTAVNQMLVCEHVAHLAVVFRRKRMPGWAIIRSNMRV
jgi:hypothetical protein